MNFTNPVNLFPAAIGLITGAGNLTWTFDHGNVSFNGIALGAFSVIIAYQVMRYLSRFGLFHDGQPAEPLTPASEPPEMASIDRQPGAPVPAPPARPVQANPAPGRPA